MKSIEISADDKDAEPKAYEVGNWIVHCDAEEGILSVEAELNIKGCRM